MVLFQILLDGAEPRDAGNIRFRLTMVTAVIVITLQFITALAQPVLVAEITRGKLCLTSYTARSMPAYGRMPSTFGKKPR